MMNPTTAPSWLATHFGDDAAPLRWALPRAFGGEELDPLQLHLRYEQLARRSLEAALLLTQRDSAVGIIQASPNHAMRQRLLSEIQHGAAVTVGIAQLTTSRQGRAPALTAAQTPTGWRIDGIIPWVTGAIASRSIIAGAAAEQGQILFALPTEMPGVTVQPPLQLAAMEGTLTSEVRCDKVALPAEALLIGPANNVLSLRPPSLPIPQAFLALGHCRGALDLIARHDSDRARALGARFAQQIDHLHARVLAACGAGTPTKGAPTEGARSDSAPNEIAANADPALIPLLRGQCNDLALRITHAAVALYKGSALLRSHPAQQLARQALFLLVWSCPDPVIDCTVDLLSATPERDP